MEDRTIKFNIDESDPISNILFLTIADSIGVLHGLEENEVISLLNSIDRASLLTNEQTNIVKLTMDQDQVILSSFSQEIGSVEENLSKAFYKGDPLKISFSAKYLTDAIKSINGQKVRVLFTGEMRPFIIKDFEREDIIQLVLPVRTY